MGHLTVNQGLQQKSKNDAAIGAVDVIDSIALTNFGTLLATTTTLAAATNKTCIVLSPAATLDITTPSAPFVNYTGTFPNGATIDGKNFTNITVHRDSAGVFTGLHGGVDGQSFTYTGVDVTATIQDKLTSG